MGRLLREPLVHFLILGTAPFTVFGLTSERERPDARRIVVTAGEVDRLGDVSLLAPGVDAATPGEIARQFGAELAEALVALEPGRWAGPIPSPFGLHLVRVSRHQPARQPALAEVRDAVLAEWRDQRRREAKEQAYRRLRERYDIVRERQTKAGEGDAAVAAKSDAARAEPEARRCADSRLWS